MNEMKFDYKKNLKYVIPYTSTFLATDFVKNLTDKMNKSLDFVEDKEKYINDVEKIIDIAGDYSYTLSTKVISYFANHVVSETDLIKLEVFVKGFNDTSYWDHELEWKFIEFLGDRDIATNDVAYEIINNDLKEKGLESEYIYKLQNQLSFLNDYDNYPYVEFSPYEINFLSEEDVKGLYLDEINIGAQLELDSPKIEELENCYKLSLER